MRQLFEFEGAAGSVFLDPDVVVSIHASVVEGCSVVTTETNGLHTVKGTPSEVHEKVRNAAAEHHRKQHEELGKLSTR